jgi:tryptophan synthase beta subunit
VEVTEPKDSVFGRFGGRYVPETLMGALHELEEAYNKAKEDPSFIGILAYHLFSPHQRNSAVLILMLEGLRHSTMPSTSASTVVVHKYG